MSDRFIIKRGGSGGSGGGVDPSIIERTVTNVTSDMLQGVTSIGECAFCNWSGLTSITIPNSVTSIGDFAFSGCSNLTSITIPNSVTNMQESIFFYCKSLVSVTIKAKTPPTLDYNIFYNNSPNLAIYVPAESVYAYKAVKYWSAYADKIQAIPSEGD